MSTIISSKRDGTCGFCLYDFSPTDEKLTHEGGEGHDGFHKSCLVEYLIRNQIKPKCPYDGQVIDPKSLISRTDRLVAKLKPALTNAAYVACLGIILGVTAEKIAEVTSASIVGLAIGAAAVPITKNKTSMALYTLFMLTIMRNPPAEIGTLAFGTSIALLGEATAKLLTVTKIKKAVLAGTIAAISTAPVVTWSEMNTKTMAAIARIAAITAGGVAVGNMGAKGMKRFFNFRNINQIGRGNIKNGIQLGLYAGFAVASLTSAPLAPTIALVGLIATGILSLVRT